jgi:DUF917 family protein
MDLRGTTRFAGLDGDAGSIFEIASQNEFTVGWRDGSVAVTTPDLICVPDSASGEAIGTESLRYGQRVSVIALPSPQIHRTAKGLQHVGPRAFGYDTSRSKACSSRKTRSLWHKSHRHRRWPHRPGKCRRTGRRRHPDCLFAR